MSNKSSQQILAQMDAINKEKAALQNQQAQLQAEEMRWNLLYQVYCQGVTLPKSAGFVSGKGTTSF
ncbi:MAG: hypothetical protein L0332_23975 [Chloroflexi bacterium]|nr:hypothetical protein [Chloroflexota bacterium]MCI0643708.1 hypothetical protein [Chloroflexota bacterium]MCI0729752.1 hypothetical protein [Chloroflexota bacterium]